MKSKISLFDRGVSANLLRRCWPLWAGYFAAAMFILPVSIYSDRHLLDEYTTNLNIYVMNSGVTMVYLSFAVGLIAAMAMFSFMYNSRSCGMMCSLPLRRETMFLTAYLTGLLPLLLADVAVMLITAAFTVGGGIVGIRELLLWLIMAAMGNISFYGFAVFCAVLTGSLLILPLVYAVLNLASWVAEGCIRSLLSTFVYGMSVQAHFFDWLSPIVVLTNELFPTENWESGAVGVAGFSYLAAYCAAGLVLSGAALLLYRRRKMETATDVVAVRLLKPVFKYCMTFGCAVVFSYAVYETLLSRMFRGFSVSVVVLLLMLAGALIGYFVSEMLMQKTVRVFKGRWKGYAVSCLVLALLTGCFELDVFGYEKYVPDIERIKIAGGMNGQSVQYRDRESLEKILEAHRQLIANKDRNEHAEVTSPVTVRYTLDNGRSILRVYDVDSGWETINEPGSDMVKLQEIVNLQEAIDQRTYTDIPVNEHTVRLCCVDWYMYGEDGEYSSGSVELSAGQAVEFYKNCLRPDIQDGTMGRLWMTLNREYYATATNVRINMEISNIKFGPSGELESGHDEYWTFTLNMDAERCMRWIEENTDIEPLPLAIADPPQADRHAHTAENGAAYIPEK